MGRGHVISALLLLFVAGSGSQDLVEDTTTSMEISPTWDTSMVPSTDSPSVKQLEVVASSADPGVPPAPVAKAVEVSSRMPNTAPKGVASTLKDVKDRDGPSSEAPTTALGAPSPTSPTVDGPTKEFDGPQIPVVDHDATANNGTDDGSEIPVVDHGATATPNNGTDDGSEIPVVDHGATATPNNGTGDDEGHGEDHTDGGVFPNGSTTTESPGRGAARDKSKDITKVVIIGIIIFVLVVLLAIMIFFLLRKKKRSGSFRTHSGKRAGGNVWAGQVPELGEGRGAPEENGAAGAQAGKEEEEEEMTTFVTGGEKKVDSVLEMSELGSGEKPEANGGEKLSKEEEKAPLLEGEEASNAPPKENFLDPPME